MSLEGLVPSSAYRAGKQFITYSFPYAHLLNSVKDTEHDHDVQPQFLDVPEGSLHVNIPLIYTFKKELKSGKAKRSDYLQADHLKHATVKIHDYLCLLLNTITCLFTLLHDENFDCAHY